MSTHHAEAILRAAGSSLRHYEPRTREAILAAVREAVEAERRAVGDFPALRDLIAEVAADLSQVEPFWTAGCLADALIKKGVTALPTPPRGE